MTTYKDIYEFCLAVYGVSPEMWRTLGAKRVNKYVSRQVFKYTECGAWLSFQIDDSGNIPGIVVGSIVEGSDAEVPSEHLEFPFTGDEFDEVVQRIEDEADYLWRQANGDVQEV